ncbi:hypothetical protein ACFCXP_14050 [Streptomyces niveus]|uniref:hypothetical protein n=1 Tax=Streptomyces niveus TaxID=193462 RepID=UPI0035E0FAE2
MPLAQSDRDLGKREPAQINVLKTSQQHGKRQRLTVLVRELLRASIGKEQVLPVAGQDRERSVSLPVLLAGEAFGDLVTQQGADSRDALDQFVDAVVDDGRRQEEVREGALEPGVRDDELPATGIKVSDQDSGGADLYAETVDRPLVSVGVQHIVECLDLLPLLAVVALHRPLLRVGPRARLLQLDVPYGPAAAGDGEVGPDPEFLDATLTVDDELEALPRGHAAQQMLHRRGQAVLLTADRPCGTLQLGPDLLAELGDEVRDRSGRALSRPDVPSCHRPPKVAPMPTIRPIQNAHDIPSSKRQWM